MMYSSARRAPTPAVALLSLALALALGWAAPSAAQEPVQGAAPTPEPESIWARDKLGADWAGLRPTLDQNGVRANLWATGFYQGMPKGTGKADADFSGRVDLLLNADTAKLGLWQGGGLHMHATYRGGDLAGFRGGALLPVHTSGVLPLDGEDEVVASSIYVSQRFGAATRLMLGKINALDLPASHPFFGGWGTDRFWNVAFVAPPSGVLPPVIMGGILTHSFAPYSVTAMVFDPSDQTNNYSFNRLFANGVNVSLSLARSGELAGRKSGVAFTAIYSTAEGADWTQIGLPAGSKTTPKKGSYNLALDVSHLLVESAREPGKGLGLYAKVAFADGNPNPVKRSFVGGVAGQALVPGRPLDYFGVGYFFFNFSDELQHAVASVGSFNDEQGIEAYYTFVPAPWLRLTADLQYVNPAYGANQRVWTAGVRARVEF